MGSSERTGDEGARMAGGGITGAGIGGSGGTGDEGVKVGGGGVAGGPGGDSGGPVGGSGGPVGGSEGKGMEDVGGTGNEGSGTEDRRPSGDKGRLIGGSSGGPSLIGSSGGVEVREKSSLSASSVGSRPRRWWGTSEEGPATCSRCARTLAATPCFWASALDTSSG